MFALYTPPRDAHFVRSDDPDEVTSLIVPYDGYHSRVLHGTGRYGFESAFLTGRQVRVGWARTALAHAVRGSLRDACIQVSMDTVNHYSFGRQRLEVAPGTLTFIGPGSGFTRKSNAGSMFAMDVDGAALAAEAQARRPGAALDWARYPQCLNLLRPEKRALVSVVADIVLALGAKRGPAQRTQCEGRLLSLLAGMLLPSSTFIRTEGVAAQRLADLEAWIDAHLGEQITFGRLCEAAGVGDRSLHLAFQARRGMSPMRFVTERRLAAALVRLSKSEPGEDVTRIATELGFSHLGRFAIAYREAYGELPSQTLRRVRVAAAISAGAATTPFAQVRTGG
jgi:AraC-like DNA-binding protein